MSDESASWEEFEEHVFTVLNDAFRRQECAAKAAARLEKVVVDRYEEEQQPPTTAAEEVAKEYEGEASREFSADEFLSLFTSTNMLKLVRELLAAMDMQELEEEITTMVIRDSFQQKPSGSGSGVSKQRGGGEGEQFIGTDKDLFLHNMRDAAERVQRGQKR